jgi:hypothetical protein
MCTLLNVKAAVHKADQHWILSCLAIILSVCSYFKPEKKQEQLLQKIELILPETKKNTLLQYDSLAKTLPKKTS